MKNYTHPPVHALIVMFTVNFWFIKIYIGNNIKC